MDIRALPFSAYPGVPPDTESARCGAWGAYHLPIPQDRLLPFVLSRPYAGPNSRLNCASLVDAVSYKLIVRLSVDPNDTSAPYLPTQKATDGRTEWILYYGGVIQNIPLVCGRPVRLILDNGYQSAAMVPVLHTGLILEWYHSGVLQDIPYGVDGFAQRLYLPGTELLPADSALTVEEDTDALTGATTVTSQTLTYNSSFSVVLPVWAARFWQTIPLHRYKFLSSFGDVSKLSIKQTDMGDGITQGCRLRLDVTVQQTEILHVGSGCDRAALPVLVEEAPAGFSPRAYLCGDDSDTRSDWQRTGQSECEQDGGANWQRTGTSECEQG